MNENEVTASRMNMVAGIANGVGGLAGLASVPAQYVTNQAATKEQNAQTRENMRYAASLQHEFNRTAIAEQVQGLRDAGLAINSAGDAKPAAVPSAPAGAKADPVDAMANIAAAQSIAQDAQLKAAQTELVSAEAQSQRIQNARENNADNSAREQLRSDITAAIKAHETAGLDTTYLVRQLERLDEDETFNLGDISGSLAAARSHYESYDAFNSYLESMIEQSGIIEQLSEFKKGSVEYRLMKEELALKSAQLANVKADTANREADLPNIKKGVQRIEAEISHLKASGRLSNVQADQIRNSDPYTALHEGRVGDAGLITLGKTVEAGAKGAGEMLPFAMVPGGGAVKAGKAAVKAGRSALKTVGNTAGKAKSYLRGNPFPKGSPGYADFESFAKYYGYKNAVKHFRNIYKK